MTLQMVDEPTMKTGELTGTGHRQAGEQPRGILPDRTLTVGDYV